MSVAFDRLTLSRQVQKEIKKAEEKGGDFSHPTCFERAGRLTIQYRCNGNRAEIKVPKDSWSGGK